MRVDFYLLSNPETEACWLFTCRLIEKAYLRGHRLFVLCANQQEAEYLDELLWTFQDDSFIPHNLQGEGPEPPPSVQIGFEKEPRGFNDILINFADPVPTYAQRFNRVIEVIASNEEAKIMGRHHYRYYQAKGCTPHIHEITN